MATKNLKALYDTCRALTRQIENIVGKTDGTQDGHKVDENILNTLKGAFKEILEFEKYYLIRCEDRFYGTILMDMDFDVDLSQKGPVDLKIKTTPYVLSVNPLYCADYNFNEFTGLIIEEIVRMIYLHPTIFASKNKGNDPLLHEHLEHASDAAASGVAKRDIRLDSKVLRSESKVRLPKDAYTNTSLNEECGGVRSQDNMPMEYYYDILKKLSKRKPQPPQPAGNNQQIATKGNNSGNPVHSWEESDEDETKETITSMVSNAYNSLDERSRGELPSSILSQIKKLIAPPEINWKQVLRKMVGSIPVPYRKTRTRLNRRQPYRSDLSGKLPKRTVDVVCCFDTSGSMSDSDLQYCLNEVLNIVKVYEGFKITVVECDSTVQRVYTAKSMADLQPKMMGRGGTWFSPAIEYINGEGDYKNNPKFPNAGHYRNALMVYFTDGYGESEIPKPKTYRNLWVVLHDTKCLSLKEPYGDVKSLSMDRDFKKFKGIN